jgi:hypothetical protein
MPNEGQKISLRQLEFELLTAALVVVRSGASYSECERVEAVVNQAATESKNVLLKALWSIADKNFKCKSEAPLQLVCDESSATRDSKYIELKIEIKADKDAGFWIESKGRDSPHPIGSDPASLKKEVMRVIEDWLSESKAENLKR